MSALPKPRKLTAIEYLAIEEEAEFKSEFYNGEMFAMAGASWEHSFINNNLVYKVGDQLVGGPCRTASNDLRMKVEEAGLYTYPDMVIICGKPEFDPRPARITSEFRQSCARPLGLVSLGF